MEIFNQSFTLDKETKEFLENQKWQLRKPKSQILRQILRYFKDNPQNLYKIMEGNCNGGIE